MILLPKELTRFKIIPIKSQIAYFKVIKFCWNLYTVKGPLNCYHSFWIGSLFFNGQLEYKYETIQLLEVIKWMNVWRQWCNASLEFLFFSSVLFQNKTYQSRKRNWLHLFSQTLVLSWGLLEKCVKLFSKVDYLLRLLFNH